MASLGAYADSYAAAGCNSGCAARTFDSHAYGNEKIAEEDAVVAVVVADVVVVVVVAAAAVAVEIKV